MDPIPVPNQPLPDKNSPGTGMDGGQPQSFNTSQPRATPLPPDVPPMQEATPIDLSSFEQSVGQNTPLTPLTENQPPAAPAPAPLSFDAGFAHPAMGTMPSGPNDGQTPILPDPAPLEQPLIVSEGSLPVAPGMENQSPPPPVSNEPVNIPPPPPPAVPTGGAQPPSDTKHSFFRSKTFFILIFILLTTIIAMLILFVFGTKSPAPVSAPTQPSIEEVAAPLTLSIESPTDGTVVTNGEVMVKGKTLPNTLVVFYTESADNSVESDANGNFEGNIALALGVNTLTITAITERDDEKSIALDIVYDEQ